MSRNKIQVGDCVEHADFDIPADWQTAEKPVIMVRLTVGRIVALHHPSVSDLTFAETHITLETPWGNLCTVPLAGARKISILEMLAYAAL